MNEFLYADMTARRRQQHDRPRGRNGKRFRGRLTTLYEGSSKSFTYSVTVDRGEGNPRRWCVFVFFSFLPFCSTGRSAAAAVPCFVRIKYSAYEVLVYEMKYSVT